MTSTTNELKGQLSAPAQQETAPAVEVKQNAISIAHMLSKDTRFKNQLAMALPKLISAERMTRVVLTECRKNPALLSCTLDSFRVSVLLSASLGLEPGSALGHAYLIPFERSVRNGENWEKISECQLIIGYRGMIALARRSGEIVSISAYAVHEKDHFKYTFGLNPDIEHVPSTEKDPGAVTFAYAVAKLKDGGVQFEVMSRAQLDDAAKKDKKEWDSKARKYVRVREFPKSGPWVDHFEEMAKKTAVRRLFKYLPVSIEAARAVEYEERTERDASLSEDEIMQAVRVQKGLDVGIEDIEPTPAAQIEHAPAAEPTPAPSLEELAAEQ